MLQVVLCSLIIYFVICWPHPRRQARSADPPERWGHFFVILDASKPNDHRSLLFGGLVIHLIFLFLFILDAKMSHNCPCLYVCVFNT